MYGVTDRKPVTKAPRPSYPTQKTLTHRMDVHVQATGGGLLDRVEDLHGLGGGLSILHTLLLLASVGLGVSGLLGSPAGAPIRANVSATNKQEHKQLKPKHVHTTEYGMNKQMCRCRRTPRPVHQPNSLVHVLGDLAAQNPGAGEASQHEQACGQSKRHI